MGNVNHKRYFCNIVYSLMVDTVNKYLNKCLASNTRPPQTEIPNLSFNKY